MAVNPAVSPRSLTTRLAFGRLISRTPVAVWKLSTTISLVTTWTMSVSSHTLSTFTSPPRTTMPPIAPGFAAASVLPRTSGPKLSSNSANRPLAPVLRPGSGTARSESELTLMLITAPALPRKSLPTMTGCAPRTKIVAASFVPRPVRLDAAWPDALFSRRLLASRNRP